MNSYTIWYHYLIITLIVCRGGSGGSLAPPPTVRVHWGMIRGIQHPKKLMKIRGPKLPEYRGLPPPRVHFPKVLRKYRLKVAPRHKNRNCHESGRRESWEALDRTALHRISARTTL